MLVVRTGDFDGFEVGLSLGVWGKGGEEGFG